MAQLKDAIGFRHDLFFGGAVQIDWFETDPQKRDLASANFVFHGPEYFGVTDEDKEGAKSYALIDTVSLTSELLAAMTPGRNDRFPITLAIAGYGAGKSHYALTLASLLSAPSESIADVILNNIEHASPALGKEIHNQVDDWDRPFLVLPINGMTDFNLAEELSRQVLAQLRARNLDTTPVEDLWPRFQDAEAFVERNFEKWRSEFEKVFGPDIESETIQHDLRSHNESTFQQVNGIYEAAIGKSIRVSGAESANQLITTVCQEYCGDNGPFQGLVILFDEFGRYLEFAIEKPHVAGDAALQQVFEGVQDNAERCFMLCTIQYELKTYISRVSSEKRNVIQRYVGRYDAARKYYLSSNLETLFAHLIEKKQPTLIEKRLLSDNAKDQWEAIHAAIGSWFPQTHKDAVWRETDPFFQTIVKGCWPLHPMATLFLTRLGNQLQQRSAVTFIDTLLRKESDRNLNKSPEDWTLPATALFQMERGLNDPLLRELIGSEEFATSSSLAHAYSAVEERYQHDFKDTERRVLLSILVADKMGLRAVDQTDYHQALAHLSGQSKAQVDRIAKELTHEYNVLEWNDRFVRYDIISEGIPRSRFTRFLDKKIKEISLDKVEDLFTLHLWKWADLETYQNIDPEFAAEYNIITSEWRFQTVLSNRMRIDQDMNQAVMDWQAAVRPDQHRGQLIYCYVPADARIDEVRQRLSRTLDTLINENNEVPVAPVFVAILHDKTDALRHLIAEYWVLSDGLSVKEKQTYKNFIDDQQYRVSQEIQNEFMVLIQEGNFVFPRDFRPKNYQIEKVCLSLFENTYPNIVPFPFDGLKTTKGKAADYCREITAELFRGSLNEEWLSRREENLQRRAKQVLLLTWHVLSKENGRISWYPEHQQLRDIIENFEVRLEKDQKLNLGEMAHELIAPPYGFNIASAGMLIGSFISPRVESLSLIWNGESISWSVWLSNAFVKKFLDLKKLDETEIEQVDTDEWQILLERWTAETEHTKCVDFMWDAEKLNLRIPLSSDLLLERWKNLKEKAERSEKALKEFDNFIERELKYLQSAFEKEDVGNISRIGKDALHRYKKMSTESNAWTDEQLEQVEQIVNQAKAAVESLFQEWLQNQSCIHFARIDSFRDKMINKIGGNLKELGLTDFYNQLEERTQKIIADMENRQKVSFIVDEAKAFLVGKTVSDTSKIATLGEWIDRCSELTKDLKKAKKSKDVPEIDKAIARLSDFQKACKEQRKQHRNRCDEFFDRTFSNIEDIRAAHVEVRDLMAIFSGEDLDIEELNKMENRLTQFEQDFSYLNDLSKSENELRQFLDERIRQIHSEEEKDEDLPLWRDAEDIYDKFMEHILADRKKRSSKWIEEVFLSQENIKNMEAANCQRLLSRLEAAPIYLTSDDHGKIEEMKITIKKRLENLKVEGLLVQFRKLPQKLKQEFYDIIAHELLNPK